MRRSGVVSVRRVVAWTRWLLAAASIGGAGPPVASAQSETAPATEAGDEDIVAQLRRGSVRLTVSAAVEQALQAAAELRKGRAGLRGAQARDSAADVRLLPRLGLSAQYRRTSEVEATLTPQDPQQISELASARAARTVVPDGRLDVNPFPQYPNIYAARVELSYSLTELLWVTLPSRSAARESVRMERWNLRATRAHVGLRAREATYGYLRARARLLAAQGALSRARRQREEIGYRLEAGVASKSEIVAADNRVSQATLNIARARGPLWRAKAELEAVLGRRLPEDIGVDEPIDREPVRTTLPTPDALTAIALERRPEIIALRQLADVRRSEHDATTGAQLPALSVVAGIDLQNPAPRSFPYRDRFGTAWDVGAMLSWSPNDWLAGSSRTDEQRAAVAQAVADLEVMRTAIRQEVAQARADYVASVEALQSARANVEIAEENYEVHHELFRLGRVASLDLMLADQALGDARLDFIDTAIDVRLAEIHLEFAQGATP